EPRWSRTRRGSSLTRLHEKVTQFAAQHFAQSIAWKGLDEDHARGSLVIDQPRRAVGSQPALIERRIVADDDRGDPLAAAVVGQPDHGRLAHAGAFVQDTLDNRWVHVEAAGDDQIVLATDQS